MQNAKQIAVLRNLRLFRKADDAFLQKIVPLIHPIHVNAGTLIVQKGENGDSLYIISRGTTEILKEDNQTVLVTLTEGDIFGEMALIFNEPRKASVRAQTDCELYQLCTSDFHEVSQHYPDIRLKIRGLAISRKTFDKIRHSETSVEAVEGLKQRMIVRHMNKSPLFSSLPLGFLESLAAHFSCQVFPSQKWVVRKGETGTAMYLVARGSLEVLDNETQLAVDTMAAGDVFGEMALVFNEPRSASIRTQTLCELYQLTQDDFLQAAQQLPELEQRMRELAHDRKQMVESRRYIPEQTHSGLLSYSPQELLLIQEAKDNQQSVVETIMNFHKPIAISPQMVAILQEIGDIIKIEPSPIALGNQTPCSQLKLTWATEYTKEQIAEDLAIFPAIEALEIAPITIS